MRDGSLTLGLVLTLQEDPARRSQLLSTLAGRDDVLLAAIEGHRLPIALETCPGQDREAVAALEALPGVVFCDVVYAHFDHREEAP